MLTHDEIIAELQRRGVTPAPSPIADKASILAELSKRGLQPHNAPSSDFEVSSPTTATANVPANIPETFSRESAGRLAKTLPVIGAAAVPMLAPEAGLLATSALAGAGASAGETSRQLVAGEPLNAPKIGKTGLETGLLTGGLGLAGKAAVGASKATGRLGARLIDFLGKLKGGTTTTAAELSPEARAGLKYTVDDIKNYAQDVSDAISSKREALGQHINNAIDLHVAGNTKGVVDTRDVLKRLNGVQQAVSGMPEEIQKSVEPLVNKVVDYVKLGKQTLNVSDLNDLRMAANNMSDFAHTMPGSGNVTQAAKQFGGFIRDKIAETAPRLDSALKAYQGLIDDSTAVEEALKIKGGERITPERVMQIEKNLSKFLKSDKLTSEMLKDISGRLFRNDLGARGKGLALAQQLATEGPSSSNTIGGLVGTGIQALSEGPTRAILNPAVTLGQTIGAGTKAAANAATKGAPTLAALLAARKKQ